MKYIGNCNKYVTCIYGSYNIKEGEDVPVLIAVKFPQYITKIQDEPVSPIITEMLEEIKNERKKEK